MNLVKWKLLETFTADRWANWGLSIRQGQGQRPPPRTASKLLWGPWYPWSLDSRFWRPRIDSFSIPWFHVCVHVRPESILRYVTSVTICHHLSPSVWKDSLCLFNDLIACLKGEGMLRWTSPWGPQASQDSCLKISWFLLRFCFIQNLRVWWLGRFQTFNASQCKSMQVNASQCIYFEAFGFWLLDLYSIAIIHKCSFWCSFGLWIVSLCGFWQRDQLRDGFFLASGRRRLSQTPYP